MSQTWESAQVRGRLTIGSKPGGGSNLPVAAVASAARRPDMSNKSEQAYLRSADPAVYASPAFAGPLPFSNLPHHG